jgi:lipopolysaccharide heptosyltransferase II
MMKPTVMRLVKMLSHIRLLKLLDKAVGGFAIFALPRGKYSVPQSLCVPTSVLIIRPGGIGDAALLIPAIRELKKSYRDVKITVLAEKRNGAIFSMCPAVDKVFLYDRPRELIAALRCRYNLVIDTEQWHRLSAVVARFTRAPLIIGYGTNDRKRLFTQSVTYSHSDYEADSFFNLFASIGIARPDEITTPFLVIPEVAKQSAETMLGNLVTKAFVVIFPGASIPERRWGADKYGEMAARLYRKGFPVVVVGGKEDAADGEMIIAGKFGLNLAGKTSLVETAAVIDKATLLVSADSGILHIGVGLGKPTVSLFGPGIAKKWAPQCLRHIVINKNLPCSPCTKFGYTPKCSINSRCMADITVNEVVSAAEKLLKRGEAKR